ncbi:hypothetical protein FOA43_003472 [Brettanomyces nanus]|uniref:Glycoside hydrolase family 125 protein n=1 Tax=Eeniella nana TaxID=13502 RepID=A0A875S451_EENNA|nr:uncharacterized protein FOA43_003472 [Brettanomyces nanus]QPG76086.1 hypothetical protein FOA43_003472 [Brettanomyces nanus]
MEYTDDYDEKDHDKPSGVTTPVGDRIALQMKTHRKKIGICVVFLCFIALVRRIFLSDGNNYVSRLGMQQSSLCPNYSDYSKVPHRPKSTGRLHLPYMRPRRECRTFGSKVVEQVIEDLQARIEDPDLFRLFENAFPNTLDTTVWWYEPSDKKTGTPRAFIATGDIAAEWLRDSAHQLSVYIPLIPYDENLQKLVKGAIVQQALYIRTAAYCNAFQPPKESRIESQPSAIDFVGPRPNWDTVFECKWEIDSLASFLSLTNQYIESSGDTSILTQEAWVSAFKSIIYVLRRQIMSSFDKVSQLEPPYYVFQRDTSSGTETLPLGGRGNPVARDIGLIRSAFRPSDDACIFQFFIPGNAHLAVELVKLSPLMDAVGLDALASKALYFGTKIKKAIMEHAVVESKKYGKVFAYEIDGFGGINMMDDANIPSLLSLPDLGFIKKDDEIYKNTRKMILSEEGNPYYLKGNYFEGIGGPHIGLRSAWPLSLLVQIRTSDDDDEILKLLDTVLTTTGGLGLMHESIHINSPSHAFTRSWFSWCNSEFAKTILDLAERKPKLIFRKDYADKPYKFAGL